jgi:rhodanese-related sulfurtransferase
MELRSTTALCALLIAMVTNVHADDSEHTKDTLEIVKRNLAEKKAVLVDVREKNEWDQGHLRGSILFPSSLLRDLDAAKPGERLPKDKILYTFCAAGIRSVAVGEVLRERGYEVRALQPGYRQLIQAGFQQAPDEQP